jgi:cation diffusion facilitator CzcD-associated flavoprotein CzcO
MFQIFVYNYSRKNPKKMRNFLLGEVRKELGPDFDVKTHFAPNYNPWDQRLCAVPDGDMFEAIRESRADIVTDQIDRFTDKGLELASGNSLDADIVVLATGLNMKFMGGIQLTIDAESIDPASLFAYKGMMFSNVPNLVQVFGYTNASWTLKSDLTADYVCRLLNLMKSRGATSATPRLAPGSVKEEPMLDFTSGYVLRAIDEFPKQGNKLPWRVHQNYIVDFINLRLRRLRDDTLDIR